MNRKHATGIALLIALAAVAGLLAVARTTGLAGASGSSATTALVQARTAQLDRYETVLRDRVAAVDAQLDGRRLRRSPGRGEDRLCPAGTHRPHHPAQPGWR